MTPEPQYLPDPAIYESLEALDDYLLNIRARREQRRQYRLEIDRLQTAINKVREEIEAAQQDDDLEITLELQGVLQEFERRLSEIHHPTQPEAVNIVQPAIQETGDIKHPLSLVAVTQEQEPVISPLIDTPLVAEQEPALPLISNEEKVALQQSWLTEIDELAVLWKELDTDGLRLKDGQLNRPACFRMRSIACTLARIQSEAENMGMASQIKHAANILRDKMALARTYAGDASKVLPVDETAWANADPPLTAGYWVDLEHLYSEVAEAQEIWDWYITADELSQGVKRDLLNAIGAAQQMLFRALDEYEGKDWLQGDLYGNLRKETSDVGFLISLNPDTGWDDLDIMSQALPTLYSKAIHEVETAKAKREKVERKQAAIQAVIDWHSKGEVIDLSEEAMASEREKLLPLLDECIEAGVPATNVQVRTALLNSAPVLLNDLSPYGKFMDAVLTERKRKKMDLDAKPEVVDEADDIPDTHLAEYTDIVRLLVEGKKLLILGGTARQQVAQKLKDMLGCADAKWADSKKGDPISKFKTQITRSDIVVLVKNYASHEMVDKGRDLARANGNMFVLLPSGYGVNQIIQQMYDQLVSGDGLKMKAVEAK